MKANDVHAEMRREDIISQVDFTEGWRIKHVHAEMRREGIIIRSTSRKDGEQSTYTLRCAEKA